MAISLDEYKRLRRSGLTQQQISEQQGATGITGVGVGAGKGIGSTAFGLGQIGTRIGRALLPKALEPQQPTIYEKPKPSFLEPRGTAEKVGFGAEQIAEFLVPSSKIAKLERGAGLAKRSIIESGTFGGVTAAQTGGDTNEIKTAMIIGAAFPVVGAGIKALRPTGKIRKAVGEKIQQTVIRPTQRDVKDGFNIKNLTRYKIGGSLSETATKTHIELNKRVKQLQDITQSNTGKVNLSKVVTDTIKTLGKEENKFRKFGNIKALEKAVKDLKEETGRVIPKSGNVNLVEATYMKRGAGSKGAWAFGQPDRDAKALETVYTTFYHKLKKEIESAARNQGKDIQRINKEISDLIPISNAVIRRLPIDQRNNVLSLTDSIGLFSAVFDPRALLMVGANRLSKSGKFGEFLARTGQKAQERAIAPVQRGALRERAFGGTLPTGKQIKKGFKAPFGGMSIQDIMNAKTRTPEFKQAIKSTLERLEKIKSTDFIKNNKLNLKLFSKVDDIIKTLEHPKSTMDEQKKALLEASKIMRDMNIPVKVRVKTTPR